MDALTTLLLDLKKAGQIKGQLLGLLHILIGRRVTKKDGTIISTGMSWRQLAVLFKRLRWEPETVRELGVDPEELPPRDRERFWYSAIARAGVDTAEAAAAGDKMAALLKRRGYEVGPALELVSPFSGEPEATADVTLVRACVTSAVACGSPLNGSYLDPNRPAAYHHTSPERSGITGVRPHESGTSQGTRDQRPR